MLQTVRRRLRARFILALSIVALVSAGISFLVLVPSYLTLTSNASGISAAAVNLSSESASDTAALVEAKSLLTQLAPIVSASTTPAEAILSALALRPPGVKVDQITYIAGATASLMLVGSAANNGDISAYQLALSGDPLFSSVSVPVGALVGTDGGRFSITLSGKF